MIDRKRWIAGLLIASTCSMGLMGCTDDQIAEAVGDVAIIAGAVLIATTTTCVGGYNQVCHEYQDNDGHFRNECEQTYDPCAVLVPNSLTSSAMSPMGVPKGGEDQRDSAPAVNEVNWGKTFDISFAASKQFIDAMEAAKARKIQPILDLGLSRDDLKKIASYQLPSQDGLNAMAKKLDISKDSAQSMIQKLVDQAKVEQATQAQQAM